MYGRCEETVPPLTVERVHEGIRRDSRSSGSKSYEASVNDQGMLEARHCVARPFGLTSPADTPPPLPPSPTNLPDKLVHSKMGGVGRPSTHNDASYATP